MIPEAAVEAALAVYLTECNYNAEEIVRLVLEAAARHIMREAYDAGSKVAWAAAEPTFKADGWDAGYAAGVREEQPGWTQNPYRPTP